MFVLSLSFSLLLLTLPAVAQKLPFRLYTVEDGLPANAVSTISQEVNGTLWVGTEGLSTFDGATFRNMSVHHGLAANHVTRIVRSAVSNGVMWIATIGGGVSRYSDGRFSTFIPKTSPAAAFVYDLVEDSYGDVWCITNDGLYRLSDSTFIREDTICSDASSLLWSSDSLLWIGSRGVLFTYSPATHSRDSLVLGNGEITTLFQDRLGSVWAATADSMIVKLRRRTIVGRTKLPWSAATSFADDEDSVLWIGTRNGLLATRTENFPPRRWRRFTTDNGLASNNVSKVFVDAEDNLWVGLRNTGAALLTKKHLLKFPMDDIPPGYNNAKAAVDREGHLWVGTLKGLREFWRTSDGVWMNHLHPIERAHNRQGPATVVIDARNQLWFECGDRIECYTIEPQFDNHARLTSVRRLHTGKELPRERRFFFFVDSHQNLWVSILGQGVYHINLRNPSRNTLYSRANGLLSDDIRTICEDREGNIWIGDVSAGIVLIRNPYEAERTLQTYTTSDGLPGNLVRAFKQDNEGKMWIGTRGNGLGVFQNGGFRRVSFEEGLISQTVWVLGYDSVADVVWAGTPAGVQRIDASTLRPQTFDDVFYSAPTSGLGVVPGRFIWFIDEEGVNIYDQTDVRIHTAPPPVVITGVSVSGVPIDWRNLLEFRHDENTVQFAFTGVTFREPKALRYQYRLVGLDDDWHPPTPQRGITYASLPPGSYVFEVAAINVAGVRNVTPASVAFTIVAPFWQRWWFVSGSAALLLALVGFTIRQRTRNQLKLSALMLASQEQERSRIAAELHDSLVQNLLVVKNRALVGLTRTNDAEAVSKELTQISSLTSDAINEVRDIAHNLRPYQLDRLGLSKALEALVESVNESTPIHLAATIENVDQCFSPDHAILVYRIVQECITNMMKHSQASEGQLVIRATTSTVEIVVEDNGIGFSPTTEVKGFGLGTISYRTRILSGTMDISSMAGRGTRISIQLPRHHRSERQTKNATGKDSFSEH